MAGVVRPARTEVMRLLIRLDLYLVPSAVLAWDDRLVRDSSQIMAFNAVPIPRTPPQKTNRDLLFNSLARS